MKFPIIGLLAGAVGSAATAHAGTCVEAVEVFADKHGLSSRAPSATLRDNRLVLPDTSRSDGVIRPPAIDKDAVIAPPPTARNMPTAPKIGRDRKPDGSKPTAGQRTRAESMLLAARSAADRGQEQKCYDQLQKARRILESAEN